jgi:multisubunit Na+/H+ antiporter MnhC subunit
MSRLKENITSILKWSNVGLRGLMETAIVIGMAYCGYHLGHQVAWKILLAVLFPLLGFGFWGLVDFHRFKKYGELLRLFQELLVTGLIAAALYILGAHNAGWVLAMLSIVHHGLTYLLGERLLKNRRSLVHKNGAWIEHPG